MEQTESFEQRGTLELPTEKIDLHLGQRSSDWLQYGITEAPIFFVDENINPEKSQYKAILKQDKLVAIVTRKYALYPNEEALRIAREVARQIGLVEHKVYEARGGNAIFATFLREGYSKLADNDDLKLGFSLRNSIDGSVGLGIDLFTFRRICGNGCVIGRQDLNNTHKKHLGSLEKFITVVGESIKNLMETADYVLDQYNAMQLQQITQAQAEELNKYLPEKYLPESIKVEGKNKAVQIVSLGKPQTVWAAYNNVTDKVWHNEKLDIRTKANYTNRLHMILAVATAGAQAPASSQVSQ